MNLFAGFLSELHRILGPNHRLEELLTTLGKVWNLREVTFHQGEHLHRFECFTKFGKKWFVLLHLNISNWLNNFLLGSWLLGDRLWLLHWLSSVSLLQVDSDLVE